MAKMNFKNGYDHYQRMRGITLVETMLALAIGGIVIVGAVDGVQKYNDNIKIQAAAGLLTKVKTAANLYAEDNFDTLVANAPQTLNISVLNSYLGSNILRDPFRATYVLSTRTYTYQTPDPVTGSVVNQDALQVLVTAISAAGDTQVDTDQSVRINIANTAGADTGFVAMSDGLCSNGLGASMPTGTLCGAYGAFALSQGDFPTLDGSARYGALITMGDSSVYGDQLYRYNFGDPELNTMHTTLNMDGNDIINATAIRNNELLEMQGPRARIRNDMGEVSLTSSGNLFIGSDTNTTVLTNDGSSTIPRIVSPTQGIQLGTLDNDVLIGDAVSDTITSVSEPVNSTITRGSGDLFTQNLYGSELRTNSINSLHKIEEDPLRIQDFAKGEVVVGQRARYTPANGGVPGSATYELSDGQITAGIVRTQDISCADCGGNLSDILPRWRHMGTYFINDTHSGQLVPKPACSINRRDEVNRGTVGDENPYVNSAEDNRYLPRILIMPKHMAKEDNLDGKAGWEIEFFAQEQGSDWRVFTGKNDDKARAEAFAMTYCVFVGGATNKTDPSNPTNSIYDTRYASPGSNWTIVD